MGRGMRLLTAHRVVVRSRAVAAVSASALLCVFGAGTSHAVSPADLPSPLAGPGVGELKRGQQKKIRQAWQEFLAGDVAAARKKAGRAGDLVPTRQLDSQILLTQEDPAAFDDLRALCESHPGYAAAWVTLSFAAEAFGAESDALAAAEQGAALWPEPPWNERPAQLYHRWVDDRITHADRLLADGSASEAASELEAARSLDPERSDAAVMMAEILLGNDQVAEAELILSDFPDVPDVAFLRGSIAEERGRNVELAERAVRESHSYTETEALEGGLIEFVFPSLDEILENLDGQTFSKFDGTEFTFFLRGKG